MHTGRIVESGACLQSMSSCDLWVRRSSFAPIDLLSPHNIMEIIIFSHAAEETSIQSVILNSFSSHFVFSYSAVFLHSLSAGVDLSCMPQHSKYIFSNKVSNTRISCNISYPQNNAIHQLLFWSISSHIYYDKPWELTNNGKVTSVIITAISREEGKRLVRYLNEDHI
jgi:hypothetical protein